MVNRIESFSVSSPSSLYPVDNTPPSLPLSSKKQAATSPYSTKGYSSKDTLSSYSADLKEETPPSFTKAKETSFLGSYLPSVWNGFISWMQGKTDSTVSQTSPQKDTFTFDKPPLLPPKKTNSRDLELFQSIAETSSKTEKISLNEAVLIKKFLYLHLQYMRESTDQKALEMAHLATIHKSWLNSSKKTTGLQKEISDKTSQIENVTLAVKVLGGTSLAITAAPWALYALTEVSFALASVCFSATLPSSSLLSTLSGTSLLLSGGTKAAETKFNWDNDKKKGELLFETGSLKILEQNQAMWMQDVIKSGQKIESITKFIKTLLENQKQIESVQ